MLDFIIQAGRPATFTINAYNEENQRQVSHGLQLHSLWIVPTAAVHNLTRVRSRQSVGNDLFYINGVVSGCPQTGSCASTVFSSASTIPRAVLEGIIETNDGAVRAPPTAWTVLRHDRFDHLGL